MLTSDTQGDALGSYVLDRQARRWEARSLIYGPLVSVPIFPRPSREITLKGS